MLSRSAVEGGHTCVYVCGSDGVMTSHHACHVPGSPFRATSTRSVTWPRMDRGGVISTSGEGMFPWQSNCPVFRVFATRESLVLFLGRATLGPGL